MNTLYTQKYSQAKHLLILFCFLNILNVSWNKTYIRLYCYWLTTKTSISTWENIFLFPIAVGSITVTRSDIFAVKAGPRFTHLTHSNDGQITRPPSGHALDTIRRKVGVAFLRISMVRGFDWLFVRLTQSHAIAS